MLVISDTSGPTKFTRALGQTRELTMDIAQIKITVIDEYWDLMSMYVNLLKTWLFVFRL